MALLVACSAALRCSPQYRPLAQRRCSIVAQGAELVALPSQLGRVAAWAGEVVVVKYGGHAMTDPELSKSFAADCALMQSLGVRLVVVHGGGPQINAMLKKLEIKSEFVAGLRVTDSATMDAAEMVLCGSINKQIASSITLAGGRAVGLSGAEDETDPDPNPIRPDPDAHRPSPDCELKPSPNPKPTPVTLTLAPALPLTSALDPRPNVTLTLNLGATPTLSGKDDKMVTAERKMHVEADGTEVSLGQVGEPGAVRVQLLGSLLDSGIAPLHVASVLHEDEAASTPPHPALMRPALGAPDQARARLQPRPASAHRQHSPPPPGRRPRAGLVSLHRCRSSLRWPSAAMACRTTSTRTRCRARSPRRSARARCSCSRTSPGCSTPRRRTGASCCPRSAWTT